MKPLLISLYQGDYHLGIAALINSALRSGFGGQIALYHNEPALPEWTRQLVSTGLDTFRVGDVSLSFRRLITNRHFGYEKPFAMSEALAAFPDSDEVVYADPDILFLAPWSFFENWINQGVAYCLDSQFPYLPAEHPWRAEWRKLVSDASGLTTRSLSCYPNSGFVAVPKAQIEFLELWKTLTEFYEKQGGDTSSFSLEKRYKAIVGDQDIMAAALMAWNGPESVLGPEGMGFTEYYFALSHDIGRPKAWKRNFVREAIEGVKPSRGSGLFLDHCQSPITLFGAKEYRSRKLSFRAAQTISRFWKR